MAKKKSESKSKNNGFNLTKVLGFKDMFHNEKLKYWHLSLISPQEQLIRV